MIRWMTAGESHGRILVGMIDGLPAGLPIDVGRIDDDLRRRQAGFGRGARMKIEKDKVQVVAGLRGGRTLGSPLALLIENRDWRKWKGVMDPVGAVAGHEVHCPRPGHADLAGRLKYGFDDLRDVLERASARETAMRVALGSVARQFLEIFRVDILSHVARLGGVAAPPAAGIGKIRPLVEASAVRCADPTATQRMMARIATARSRGDTLGGVFEVIAEGVPAGLGSCAQWDRRLDARLGAAFLSIPAVKGMEIGLGFGQADLYGSEVHDPILPARGGRGRSRYRRPTNHAGGLEGGMTNGEPLVIRAVMKPIPTSGKGPVSVDIRTHRPARPAAERADVCAVPAAGVVGEAVTALVLAEAMSEKFGGDTIRETEAAFKAHGRQVARR